MKIAHVCHVYSPHVGGIETHVQRMVENLSDYDVEVVCTGDKTETLYINGIKVQKFKAIAYNDKFFFAPQIYIYLKHNNFDIIHGHDMQSFPSWFASKVSTNFVFTPHYHGHTSFGKSRLEKARFVFYHSTYEKELLSRFNIPDDKLTKITNGLDPEEFNFHADKVPNRIVYAGRLEEYKNIHILIHTMELLKDHTLEIIGRGPYEPFLKYIARTHSIHNITFIPYLERHEYLRHIKQAECFVNLSSNETYSISTTEALACGTYPIVNRNTGMGDFVGIDCKGLDKITPKSVSDAIISRKKIEPRKWPSWQSVAEIYRTAYQKT